MAVPEQYRQHCPIKFFLNALAKMGLLLLLYVLILFIFEVAILKMMCNMASSKLNLTLNVDSVFSLTLTSILFYTHNNGSRRSLVGSVSAY